MKDRYVSRRRFIEVGAAVASVGFASPYWSSAVRAEPAGADLRFGAIGVGQRGITIANNAVTNGAHLVSIADVDSERTEQYKAVAGTQAETYLDYRKLLERKDIDFVAICTPDHWHTKIAIEAMQAGKDIYCEKPLSLTIDEGKLLRKVVKDTARVFQVGTQQRSEYELMFLKAVAICHAGRIGDIQHITCAIGKADVGGPFQRRVPPPNLKWDNWLGQAPKVDYMPERCHYNFRWWYDYSGGQVTDWGVHHVDIAQWALGVSATGPVTIEGTGAFPRIRNGYEAAITFNIKYRFENGVELLLTDTATGFNNGILIEGTKGRLFVNRGKLTGKPVEALEDDPLPKDALVKLYKGKQPGDHMRNFMVCIKDRSDPISDVYTHHRSVSTYHLGNIAIRLGRKIAWDPDSEQVVGDDEANSWQKRKQRFPYQIQI